MRLSRTEKDGRWFEAHLENHHLVVMTSKSDTACWSREYDSEELVTEFRRTTAPLIEVAFWGDVRIEPDPGCVFGFTTLWERLLTGYGFSYN